MSDPAQEQAVAMRRAGQSLRQIAKALGVSLGAVHKWTVNAAREHRVNTVNTRERVHDEHREHPSDGADFGREHSVNGGCSRSVNAQNRERTVNVHAVHGASVNIDPVARVLEKLKDVREESPNQWEACCPTHDDQRASLSISRGEDGRALLNCFAGCSVKDVVAELGMTLSDLYVGGRKPRPRIAKTYDYCNVDGEVLFQVVRFEPKDFRQRRPNGKGGWTWKLGDTPRVLYRLPELAAAPRDQWVFIVEGEKDVDNLWALGLPATCNPGGACKWSVLADDSHLNGRRIVVIPDRDVPGEKHAADVAHRLYGRAAEVRMTPAPEGHKDVSDWIVARDALGPDELRELLLGAIAQSPPLTQETLPQATAHVVAAEADDGQDDAPEDAAAPVELGSRDPATGRLVLSPRRTLPTAQAFVGQYYAHRDGRTLQNYAGMLLAWKGNRYVEVEDQSLCQLLQPWLHNALRYVMSRRTGEPELTDFESNPGTIKAALDSVRTLSHLPGTSTPPAWLGDAAGLPPASELLPCCSMMLHLPTLQQLTPTPRLFVTNALEFDYDSAATAPAAWLEFLDQVLPGDPASIYLLQSWFGYALTADTSHQKMMLLVGAKRSGKGTIARILTRLLGQGNICGPTTSSLAGPFGLQPLIGKLLAIVSDARFAGDNIAAVVERLLCISGEDTLTIDRKFLGSATLKLPTRFMFLTNELPKLSESSGALAGRFLVVRFTQSFFGREDRLLTEKLSAELPGILKWAVDGWHNLRRDGRFIEPEASRAASEELEDLLSPVGAFVRERCRVSPICRVNVKDVYTAWCEWCDENGRDYHGTVQSFSRDLQAAVPNVRTRRNHGFGRFMEGIQLS